MVYGVLEELPTGIWILSPTGATISINRYAHRICRLLLKSEAKQSEAKQSEAKPGENSGSAGSFPNAPLSFGTGVSWSSAQQPDAEPGQTPPLPSTVERLCQAVVESRDLFPDRPVIIEDLVQIGALAVHLRARWLELELDSYILVMLESPQIHPLAKLSKLVHRGAVRRIGTKIWQQPEQFLGQLGY